MWTVNCKHGQEVSPLSFTSYSWVSRVNLPVTGLAEAQANILVPKSNAQANTNVAFLLLSGN